MPYIIDGNNVMGQIPGWHRDKSAARAKLLSPLAAFSGSKGVRITAVFDGGADEQFPEGAAFRGVKILYAERGSDADRRIQRLVESASDPRGITVITSDRQLAFLVRSAGAKVMRSGDFRRNILENVSAYDRRPDEKPATAEDLEKWLRYFGAAPEDDADDPADI